MTGPINRLNWKLLWRLNFGTFIERKLENNQLHSHSCITFETNLSIKYTEIHTIETIWTSWWQKDALIGEIYVFLQKLFVGDENALISIQRLLLWWKAHWVLKIAVWSRRFVECLLCLQFEKWPSQVMQFSSNEQSHTFFERLQTNCFSLSGNAVICLFFCTFRMFTQVGSFWPFIKIVYKMAMSNEFSFLTLDR